MDAAHGHVSLANYVLYTVVMALGMFVRGLAGAGNAIVVLSFWAVARAVGGTRIAGPLAHIIAIECVSAFVCSLLLFFKIRAWRNVNRAFIFTVTPTSVR